MSTQHFAVLLLALCTACFDPSDGVVDDADTTGTPTTEGATSNTTTGPSTSVGGTMDTTGTDAGSSDGPDATTENTDAESTGVPPTCSDPMLLGTYPTVGQTISTAVWGTRAFATHVNDGIFILDISDPTNPAQIGAVSIPNPTAITAVGDDVYVGDPTGLYLVDAATATVVMTLATPPNHLLSGVAVADGLVYYTDNDNGDPCDGCGLHISDTAFTGELGYVPIGDNPREVAVVGSYAYVAAGLDGLVVVDVSNPSAPTIVSSTPLAGWAGAIAVDGGRAYVAAGPVEIFDIADPAAPVALGSIPADFTWDVAIVGNRLWMTSQDPGLRVVDVADPASPVELGAVAGFTAGAGLATNDDVVVVGSVEDGVRVVAPPVCE